MCVCVFKKSVRACITEMLKDLYVVGVKRRFGFALSAGFLVLRFHIYYFFVKLGFIFAVILQVDACREGVG